MGEPLQLREPVEAIFKLTPWLHDFHNRNSAVYRLFDRIIRTYFTNYQEDILDVAPFDGVVWPRISLGNVTSHDFFSFDSFIIFSLYSINRNLYKKVFDLGASIGLHSILLSRLGYEVYAFEPDPVHHDLLTKNLARNRCSNVHVYRKAVSDKSGLSDFVRVLGNVTASHISGAREFYGEIERLKVETVSYRDIGIQPDLMKVDIEGHERNVILDIERDGWENMDALVEIHSVDNSRAIFDHFEGSGVNVFTQKLGWRRAAHHEDMPTDNKDGNVFISRRETVPWEPTPLTSR